MIASERYEKIVEMVDAQGIKNTKELAQILNVTEMTIRRDCEELEKQGKLIRVRGGAKSIKKKPVISDIDDKKVNDRTEFYEEKDLVCQKAASFIKEGDCIFLDGGTSLFPILKYLTGKRVKIVTNSINIANMFQDDSSELFLIGGKYLPKYNMSVGPIALEILNMFNFDYAFISCAGIDVEKNYVSSSEVETPAIKTKAMEMASKKYLLIDSSKFDVKGFYSFSSCDKFDAIICNDDANIDKENVSENFIFVKKEKK